MGLLPCDFPASEPPKNKKKTLGNQKPLYITVVSLVMGPYTHTQRDLRAGKKLNFLWPKMARLDPFFDPKIPSKKFKFMWVPFLRPFPGNEAHQLFLSGGPELGVLAGGQKVYVDPQELGGWHASDLSRGTIFWLHSKGVVRQHAF